MCEFVPTCRRSSCWGGVGAGGGMVSPCTTASSYTWESGSLQCISFCIHVCVLVCPFVFMHPSLEVMHETLLHYDCCGGWGQGSFILKSLQEEWTDTQVLSLEISSVTCTLLWNFPRLISKYNSTQLHELYREFGWNVPYISTVMKKCERTWLVVQRTFIYWKQSF